MHLILTGATGLVGSGVLDAMIKMKAVTKISILSRRPVQMAEDAKDPRVNVIIHNDFTKYDSEVLEKLRGATGCVWALGISQTQVSKEEYIKITKDYTLAAVEAFEKLPLESPSEPFRFVFVSGRGATFKPGFMSQHFARVKGETELQLGAICDKNPRFEAVSVRPGIIDPSEHKAIKNYIPKSALRDTLMGVLGPVGRGIGKGLWSPTESLGNFLTEIALGRWEGKLEGQGIEQPGSKRFIVVENEPFRKAMGLPL